MVVPVGVPSDAKSNSLNHENFYTELKKTQSRLSQQERQSIRSGSVGGAGFRFFDPAEEGNPLTGGTTTRIGEFSDYFYDLAGNTWIPSEAVRGISLFESDDTFSWFSAGTVDNIQSFNVGYSGRTTESILFKAKLIRLDSPILPDGGRIEITEDGAIHLRSYGANRLEFNGLTTIGAGNHLVLDGDIVKYVSSARKYKQDIESAEVDPEEVLLLQGRTWRDRNEVASNPETHRRFVGFIAEELAELPSMRQFVLYNSDGEPESIYYDRLSVALLELQKRQQTQINNQEARISALEEKLSLLEI